MKNIILMLALEFLITPLTKSQQNDILPQKTNGVLTPKNFYPQKSNMALLDGKTSLDNNDGVAVNGPGKDYAFYNRRSRNQRITGLSLLGVGLVLGVSGILVTSNNNYKDYDQRDRTIRTLFILSGVTGLASIPFMIMAHASKTKARAAVSGQKTFIPGKGNSYVTGLTVSIPIGK